MPELKDLANWLGVEVVPSPVTGHVVRFRQKDGAWQERDQAATPAEVQLYDAVRGLLATLPEDFYAQMLAVLAEAVGCRPTETVAGVLERIQEVRETVRRVGERASAAERSAAGLREELVRERALPRLTPKGGDRNEFARQVRRTAHQIQVRDDAPGHLRSLEFKQGVVMMANTVLYLLGEEPLGRVVGRATGRLEVPAEEASDPSNTALLQQVHQLKADRWKGHAPGSRPYERNAGEQNAFNMVIRLLETGEVHP